MINSPLASLSKDFENFKDYGRRETRRHWRIAKGGIHAKALKAVWDNDYLLKVLFSWVCFCPVDNSLVISSYEL